MKRARLILALVLLLATIFLATQFGKLQAFAQVLARGQPIWIGLALIVQALWQLNQAAQFRASQRSAGVMQRFSAIVPVVAANNFISVAVPTGSLSTFALFLGDARRRGLPPERVTLGVAIFSVFQYLALSAVVGLALAVLAARGVLNAAEWLPALAIFVYALGQYAALLVGLRSPAQLEHLSVWLAGHINRLTLRFIRREFIPIQRLRTAADNAAGGLVAMRQQGARAHLLPLAHGLAGKALQIMILGLTLRAFGQTAAPEVWVAGVGVAALFAVVSPTPLGLGVVEGVLALLLKSLGVELEAAIIVSLAYRGFTVWLPVLYGFVALQGLGLEGLRAEG